VKVSPLRLVFPGKVKPGARGNGSASRPRCRGWLGGSRLLTRGSPSCVTPSPRRPKQGFSRWMASRRVGWTRGEPRIRPGRCLIAHTLKSTHIATALRLVVKATTVSQLVDELSRFPDAGQWLIVAFAALMVVVFTCWVGFAVVLVTRTVLSAAGFVTRKKRGFAGRADSGWGDRPPSPDPAGGRFTTGDADRATKASGSGSDVHNGALWPHSIKTSSECRLGGEPSKA
jgi:hypothetical protein